MTRFESRHSPLPALTPIVEELLPPSHRSWRGRGPLAMIDSRTGLRRVALVVAGPTGMVGSALLRLLEEKEVTARGVFADVVHAALETHSHGHCC